MRKYLLNFSVLTTIASSIGLVKTTASGPRDWRLALLWASWLISLALAIGSVAERAADERGELEG